MTDNEVQAWIEKHGAAVDAWLVALHAAGFAVPTTTAEAIDTCGVVPSLMVVWPAERTHAVDATVPFWLAACADAEMRCPPCPLTPLALLVVGMVRVEWTDQTGAAFCAYYDFCV